MNDYRIEKRLIKSASQKRKQLRRAEKEAAIQPVSKRCPDCGLKIRSSGHLEGMHHKARMARKEKKS